MNNLLSLINDPNSLGIGEACIYALIGFLVVFAGILLIIFIIWLIGLLMRKTDNLSFLNKIGKKKKSAVKEETAPEAQTDEIPAEVRVAIVAAIAAYYSEAPAKCEFKVKKIKRI